MALRDTQCRRDCEGVVRINDRCGIMTLPRSLALRDSAIELTEHLTRRAKNCFEAPPPALIKGLSFSPISLTFPSFTPSDVPHILPVMSATTQYREFDPKGMPYRRLGGSGLRVPLFSLGGCMSCVLATRCKPC